MHYLNRDRTMTQILLSLWSLSTRRVEKLPKVRVWDPSERVQIVRTTVADTYDRGSPIAAGDFL